MQQQPQQVQSQQAQPEETVTEEQQPQQQQAQEAAPTTLEELQQALASGQAILQTTDNGSEQTLQMVEGQCECFIKYIKYHGNKLYKSSEYFVQALIILYCEPLVNNIDHGSK